MATWEGRDEVPVRVPRAPNVEPVRHRPVDRTLLRRIRDALVQSMRQGTAAP